MRSAAPSYYFSSSSLHFHVYHSRVRNTTKCQGKIASLEKEVTATEQSIGELKSTLTELEEEAKEIILKQEEHQVRLPHCNGYTTMQTYRLTGRPEGSHRDMNWGN